MKRFVTIGSVLEETIRKFGLDKGIKKSEILQHWEEAVGEQIAAATRPGYVKGKTLFVFVSDSMWMQELKLSEERIIASLNRLMNEEVIDQIYFKIDTEKKRTE